MSMDERQKKLLDDAILYQRGAAIIDGVQDSFRLDGYTNLLNKYGTSQDSSTAYEYRGELITDDLELIRLYEGNGLFAKIIDRPSEEAVKHGLDIDYGNIDAADYVEIRLDELDFEDKFATAEKWARLYGGSVIVMLVDDGRGLEEPLDWKEVRSIQELRVFERAIVQPDYTSLYHFHFMDSMESGKPFGEPEYYQVFSIYGYFTVHRTRCLIFRNGRLPEQTTDAIYRYWGIPEYVKIKRALRECITAHEDGVKLMERSVQAIYKMKNLANMLSTDDGENKVLQRLQVIDMARGILNSIAIDNDGEDYDFKNTQTTGVKDIIDSTCNMLSAVTNIPQTILFGRSPSGMNATGKSDLENYYNMIENIQKQNMKLNARTLIDLIRQARYEGKISEIPKYKVKFAALWSTSDTEQAEVAQKRAQTDQVKAQTLSVYIDAGVIDPSEVRRGLAKNGAIEIQDIISEKDLNESNESTGGLNLPDDALNLNQQSDPVKQIGITQKDSSENENEVVAPDCQAAAVIIFRDGKILCASRTDRQGVCGPGGHRKPGETPLDTALREIMEEFNIVPLNLIPVGVLPASQGRYLNTMLYFADRFTGTPEADGIELIDERWIPIDETRNEPLFPAFEESLDLFREILRPFVMNRVDGSSGSGNWGHKGVPGQLGGSAPGGGVSHRTGSKESGYSSAAKERAKAKSEAKKSAANGGGVSGGDRSGERGNNRRYASKEEYQAAKSKAKADFSEKTDRINQDYEKECAEIHDKYGSKMRQRVAIRRDESLTSEQREEKLAELDRKFEKKCDELRAADEKRLNAYNKAEKECDLTFDPDYEYDKIVGKHSLKDDATAHVINPEGLHANCQRCAVAVELRPRL